MLVPSELEKLHTRVLPVPEVVVLRASSLWGTSMFPWRGVTTKIAGPAPHRSGEPERASALPNPQMMLMVWEPHLEDHSSMKWVVLSFVTVENLGKRGLLTEGDFGRVQSPVMETQTLCMACAMCHSLSHLIGRPLPFVSLPTAPSAFPL